MDILGKIKAGLRSMAEARDRARRAAAAKASKAKARGKKSKKTAKKKAKKTAKKSSKKRKGREALSWLLKNRNKYGFSSNHFGATGNAIAFVRRLYAAGAKTVEVGDVMADARRIAQEGGPYADVLYVSACPSCRARVLEQLEAEGPDELTERAPGIFRAFWD